METNNIENKIVEEIISAQNFSYDIPKKEMEEIIIAAIRAANYLKEDWQIHYAKEHILKTIKEKLEENGGVHSLVPFHYGKWFLVLLVVSSVLRAATNPIINITAGIIDLLTAQYLALWITAGIYKKQNKENKFGKAKKIISIVFTILYILLILSFVIVTIGAINASK